MVFFYQTYNLIFLIWTFFRKLQLAFNMAFNSLIEILLYKTKMIKIDLFLYFNTKKNPVYYLSVKKLSTIYFIPLWFIIRNVWLKGVILHIYNVLNNYYPIVFQFFSLQNIVIFFDISQNIVCAILITIFIFFNLKKT